MVDLSKYKSLYLKSAGSYVQELHEKLPQLTENMYDEQLFKDLRRIAHSIKGESLTMGHALTGEYAKILEYIFIALQEKKLILSPDLIQSLNNTSKKLDQIFQAIEQTDKELDITQDIQELQKFINE